MIHMSSFLIRSGGKTWQDNFCKFFMIVCGFLIKFFGIFVKFCGFFKNFIKKKREKLEIDCFFPLLIKEMGHFKNPLWCTVDETQGAKIQIWDVPHKLTSLRNSGNFILSISMHRGQRYDSAKFCSCCLNTLYTECWGGFKWEKKVHQKFFQNPFLGCQWNLWRG